MRPRHFGAASWDDEDDEEDELDLSGFLSSAPPPPPVVERKRGASGIGNAGPRTQPAPEQEPAQMFGRPSNIGYVPAAVTAGNPWNPLYADDNAMFSPKIWVWKIDFCWLSRPKRKILVTSLAIKVKGSIFPARLVSFSVSMEGKNARYSLDLSRVSNSVDIGLIFLLRLL